MIHYFVIIFNIDNNGEHMKKLNYKQHIFLIIIIICILNIILFNIFYFFIYFNLNKVNNEKNLSYSKEYYDLSFNKDVYYIALNETVDIKINNENNIKYDLYIEDFDLVSLDDNKIKGLKYGNTEIVLVLPNNKTITSKIYVVNGLVLKPREFDKNKDYLSCNFFTNEENELIDKTLQDKMNDVEYPSRASVVEAARFLTLNFNYRIPYFYENGRLNNYGGKEYVDGEGRYYHKGLYLSESKYNDIIATYAGPSMWGCPLTNITKAHGYGYYVGKKYPNGLDCSGFISWILYNGGYDVKDTGAGETYRNDDLYDLGEKRKIDMNLLNSSEIKVGDLIAYSGHMAMIVGIYNDDIYVAESLPSLKGVVIKKYTKEKAKNTFTHIILMDSLYKTDGKITNMWY